MSDVELSGFWMRIFRKNEEGTLAATGSDSMELVKGGSIRFGVVAKDLDDNEVQVNANWNASSPDMVSLSSPTGQVITVKALKSGHVDIIAEYGGIQAQGYLDIS